LVFHSSTIAMMHGPINIRLNLRCLKYLEVGAGTVQGTPRTVAHHSTLHEEALAYMSVVKLVVQLSTAFP